MTTFTHKADLLTLALLAVMTAPATAHAATPASAPAASQWSGGHLASQPTTAADSGSPAGAPTLTNHVGGGTEQQLAFGVAPMGLGLLGLAVGLASLLATRRQPPAPPDAHSRAAQPDGSPGGAFRGPSTRTPPQIALLARIRCRSFPRVRRGTTIAPWGDDCGCGLPDPARKPLTRPHRSQRVGVNAGRATIGTMTGACWIPGPAASLTETLRRPGVTSGSSCCARFKRRSR